LHLVFKLHVFRAAHAQGGCDLVKLNFGAVNAVRGSKAVTAHVAGGLFFAEVNPRRHIALGVFRQFHHPARVGELKSLAGSCGRIVFVSHGRKRAAARKNQACGGKSENKTRKIGHLAVPSQKSSCP